MIKKFENFYIQKAEFDKTSLRASFHFSFDHTENFTEVIDFSCLWFTPISDIDERIVSNMLFHISLALGISYYKLFPTQSIIVESWKLDDTQRAFWKKFYFQWLGEFLFRNQIVPDSLCNFSSTSEIVFEKISFVPWNKQLVPIWGWKDSLVSTHLLDQKWIVYDLFTFGKKYVLHDIVAQASGKKHLVVHRHMDPHLFEMNQAWYYNGHVPITGIIAFVLQLVNYLYGYNADILSNEKSADVGNLVWHWLEVNHQYSKSKEFENDFQTYVDSYMSDTRYYSILRDLYELQIAQIFSSLKHFFPVFSSCNNNFKIIESNKLTHDRWCLQCPKCAFVFAILRPFISDDDVKVIFGRDLYEDESLMSIYQELLGYSWHKPFECVGTNEEVILALYMAYEKYIQEWKDIPVILVFFRDYIMPKISPEYIWETKEVILSQL